jgi:hypothetical protein
MFHQPQYFRHYSVTQRIAPQGRAGAESSWVTLRKTFRAHLLILCRLFEMRQRWRGVVRSKNVKKKVEVFILFPMSDHDLMCSASISFSCNSIWKVHTFSRLYFIPSLVPAFCFRWDMSIVTIHKYSIIFPLSLFPRIQTLWIRQSNY